MPIPIALVTGGNRGIGLEVVKQLAQAHVITFMGSRDLTAGEAEAKKLKSEGLDVHVVKLDVTSLDSIRKARAEIESQFKRLDILVNNAAVYLDEKKLMHELPDGVFEETLQA